MAKRSEIIGMRELERDIKRLGRVPQAAANKGASAGGRIVLRAAKQNAPVDEGDLQRGLILQKERKTKPGKAVYDVMPDPAMNDVFVDVSTEGKRSYYPASQEYGFITRDGGYVPGDRYMRRSADDNAAIVEKTIINVAGKEIDKVLKKKGLS